ncbi:MAG: glycosyltransferase family 4 protein [Bacteroidota bacterium]
MNNTFFAALTSFVISVATIPLIIKFSKNKNLDIPRRRKIHKREMPSMGGIGIYLGFLVSSLLWSNFLNNTEMKFIMASSTIIFLLGAVDDTANLSPVAKLMGQLIAIGLIVLLIDVRLKSFYGLFNSMDLPLWFSYCLTIFTMIIITNSFNLIDGLDGLAGTIAIISLTTFGIWFSQAGDSLYALLSFALLGGVGAFLFFNWEPSKIFMGDTGSLLIGLMLSILTIHFINANDTLHPEAPVKFGASIATAISIIIIPIVDTARVIMIRLRKKISPFTPDNRHVHHVLLQLGLPHRHAVIVLGVTHVFFIGLALLLQRYSDRVVLPAIAFVSTTLCIILYRVMLQKRVAKDPDHVEL